MRPPQLDDKGMLKQCYNAGIEIVVLRGLGFHLRYVRSAGYTRLEEAKAEGYSLKEMKAAGYSLEEMRKEAAMYSLDEMKAAGWVTFSAKDGVGVDLSI